MKSTIKPYIKILSFILIFTMLLSGVSCAKISDTSNSSNSSSSSNNAPSSEYSSDSQLEWNDTTVDTETSKKTDKTEIKETEGTTNETTNTDKVYKLNTTNQWKYSKDVSNNVVVRTLNITTGWGGETVTIGQATDLHINYCTSNDLKDPVLYSTYQNRKWLKDGASLPNVQRCLETLKKSDLIVITGDLYDYYSEGVVQKTNEYVFSKYDNVVASIGNHEPVRQMQGTVADSKTLEELRALVQASWCNDIEYASYVVKNKVMAVLLDNSDGLFHEAQYARFKADLDKARDKGYIVLLFYHIPMNTGNPNYYTTKELSGSGEIAYLHEVPSFPGYATSGGDKKVSDLIRNNGDIIKGCFCGHNHGDYYSEIIAKTPNGRNTIIPQYLLDGGAYDSGHVLKIVVN